MSDHEDTEALAEVLAEHEPIAGGFHCACKPYDEDGTMPFLDGPYYESHVADAVLASPWLAAYVAAAVSKAKTQVADEFHERAQAHTLATDASRAYRDAYLQAARALRAETAVSALGEWEIEHDGEATP